MSYAVRRTLVTSAAALLLSGTACSDEGGPEGEEEAPSPEDRLADAKALIDDAPSVDFSIVTESLPAGVNGLLEAEGTGTNAPDPADFFDTEEGVSSLLVATDDLEEGDAERDGEEVLTTITGTLQGDLLKALLPTADEAGTFDVTYRLTEEDALTGIEVTGPFYAGSDDVTYDLTIDPSDESVEITAP